MVRSVLFALTVVAVSAVPFHALADGEVSVVRGQFTDKVEGGKPTGDASSVASGQTAVYWVEVSNPNEAQAITLVWKLDGVEAGKQTLDVGRAPRWRTWGSWPTRRAHAVEVTVLDKTGRELKSDALTFE